MVRSFNGSARIKAALGGSTGLTGACTYLFLIKNTGAGGIAYQRDDEGTIAYVIPTAKPTFLSGGKATSPVENLFANGEWVLLAIEYPGGAEAKPVFRAFGYTSGTWKHLEGAAAVKAATSAGKGQQWLGGNEAEGFAGDFAALAIYNSAIGKAAVEAKATVTNLEAWKTGATCFWTFGQREVGQTVKDWTGNGANETARAGTTVSEAVQPIIYSPREQITWFLVTDALTGSPTEAEWTKLGWANSRGTFNATGGQGTPTDRGFVSSLPEEPVIGDRVSYRNAAMKEAGVAWELKIDGEGAYPWKTIGGEPLFAYVEASVEIKNVGYEAKAGGPALTAPLEGDYDVEIGCELNNSAAGNITAMSYKVGAAAATEGDRVLMTDGWQLNLANRRRKTALAAATALLAHYRVSAGTGFAVNRYMALCATRVGPNPISTTAGWNPPSFAAQEPSHSRGGAYYKKGGQFAGNAFSSAEVPAAYGLISGASYRSLSTWLFTTGEGVANGYQLRLRQASSGLTTPNKYKFVLTKFVAGEGTLIEETGEVTIEPGGAFALAKVGGKLIMFRRETSSSEWVAVGSEKEDSAFTFGYSGIDGNGSNPTLKNFRTGQIEGPTVTLTIKSPSATATFSAPVPGFDKGFAILAPVAASTFSAPAPGIGKSEPVSITAPPGSATFSAPPPATGTGGTPPPPPGGAGDGPLPLPFPNIVANPDRLGPARLRVSEERELGG